MLEIYVKDTSNCPGGMELQIFEELSPTWKGDSIVLPFGEGADRRSYEVVGWTDLFGGRPCSVHVTRVRHESGAEGYLVWGGNSGVRILDSEAPEEERLPAGYGRPVVWVEDEDDLPEDVLAVVSCK